MSMTKFQLFALLTNQGAPMLVLPDGTSGRVKSIGREDGSGRSFMVELSFGYHRGKGNALVEVTREIHVRTVD
jgi:hypothetical protein